MSVRLVTGKVEYCFWLKPFYYLGMFMFQTDHKDPNEPKGLIHNLKFWHYFCMGWLHMITGNKLWVGDLLCELLQCERPNHRWKTTLKTCRKENVPAVEHKRWHYLLMSLLWPTQYLNNAIQDTSFYLWYHYEIIHNYYIFGKWIVERLNCNCTLMWTMLKEAK